MNLVNKRNSSKKFLLNQTFAHTICQDSFPKKHTPSGNGRRKGGGGRKRKLSRREEFMFAAGGRKEEKRKGGGGEGNFNLEQP